MFSNTYRPGKSVISMLQYYRLQNPWDQGEPYNEFCPWVTSDMKERAPAGCVAVAGAEVLYYLHNRYGVPVNMVSEGYCNGVIGNYSRWFGNADSDVWDG